MRDVICFSGGWICSDVELQHVFVVLDQVQDFHSLVRLVLFLVSCVPATSLVPLLAVAKEVRITISESL